jgi:hypothetical protein
MRPFSLRVDRGSHEEESAEPEHYGEILTLVYCPHWQLIVNTNLAALAQRHGRSLLAKLDAALRWFEGGPVEAGRLTVSSGIDPTEVRLTVRRLLPLPRTVPPHKNRDDPGKYEIGI